MCIRDSLKPLGVILLQHLLQEVNWAKFWVGIFNIGNGLRKLKLAALSTYLGVTFTPTVVVSAAFYGYAAYNLIGAMGAFKRGFQQIAEATIAEDASDMHWRNLLGILPFGQLYDDPEENFETARKEVLASSPGEILQQVFSVF